MLYETILDVSNRQIAAVLRQITVSAETGRPLMFFCKAGKDRTGLVAAMTLAVVGASEDVLIRDYHR